MKVCCLGDVVFSTPLARALKKQWPDAELTYLTGTFSRPLAERVPGVNRVLTLPDGVFGRLRFLFALRHEHFDLALCLHKSWAAAAGLWLTRAARRVGFDWEGNRSFFTDSVPFDLRMHEVRRYLSLLAPLNVEVDGEHCALTLPADARAEAETRLRKLGWDGRPLAALFPGGGANPGTVLLAKRWTLEGFQVLAASLAKSGFQVLALGGPGEEALGKAVVKGLGKDGLDLCGQTSLPGLLGLLACCSYFVGGDSGPVHFAAALGVPTLTLFGPTEPGQWAPLGGPHAHVWRQLPCSPCFTPQEKLSARFKACPDWACLQQMPSYQVISAAEKQLRQLNLQGIRI